MAELFFYGTLRHLPLLTRVLGRPVADLAPEDAVLPDHVVCSVVGHDFPLIMSKPGSRAPGLLVQRLSAEDLDRLTFYEGGFGYDLRAVTVHRSDGSRASAQVFFPDPGQWVPDTVWELQDWVDRWGDVTLLAADEVMSHYGKADAATVARSYPAIRTRAWSKLAAKGRQAGPPGQTPSDVLVHRRSADYLNYFAMEQVDLQHRQYDGTMSPVLNRCSLMQGSAVVVLPYDPVRDQVLLVEQFRAPVFLNADPAPWMLEPIAGMIDPGETPVQAAIREAEEEAGIALTELDYVGGAYSSSGSSTEYVHLYVGRADLSSVSEFGGLLSEGEDIRAEILPFDRFIQRVDDHAFKDLPLLTLAYWLVRHRDRLRG